ncbi:MAG: hypothetical protein ACMUEL_00845 [Flavobacteriales bacterium Tduv]
MLFCFFLIGISDPRLYDSLCRFCNEIVAKKAYELLLKEINKELKKHQAIVKTGMIVDASITVTPLCSKEGSYLRSGRIERKRRKSKSVKEMQGNKRDQ